MSGGRFIADESTLQVETRAGYSGRRNNEEIVHRLTSVPWKLENLPEVAGPFDTIEDERRARVEKWFENRS